MGDVWLVDKGLNRGIYFEVQYDLDKFLDQVPKVATAKSRENPILAGIISQYAGLVVRLATPDEMVYFRIKALRESQGREIKQLARDTRLPEDLAALLMDSRPKLSR